MNWRWARLFVTVLIAYAFVPELRRLYDLKRGGFESVEVTSIVPLMLLLIFWWPALRSGWRRANATIRALAVTWCGAFAYALAMGLLQGNGLAAVYAFVLFCAPLGVGIWLASDSSDIERSYNLVANTMLAIGVCSSLYAIYQYVSPPAWDVLWVYGSKLWSVGRPEPFQMRVWGTMNSPGPFADFLICAMLLNLRRIDVKRPLVLLGFAACGIALALTFGRADWLSFVAGMVVWLVMSPSRGRAIVGVAAGATVLALTIASLPIAFGDDGAQIVQRLTDRFDTLDDLGADRSAQDRDREISDGIEAGVRNPLGEGLGTIGTAAKLTSDSEQWIAFDSGYVARFVEMGFLGTAGYLAVTIGACVLTLIGSVRANAAGRLAAAEIAVAAASVQAGLIFVDLAVDAHNGFDGVLFWVAVAIGTAATVAVPSLGRHTASVVPLQTRAQAIS